jgi:hypothetical protein
LRAAATAAICSPRRPRTRKKKARNGPGVFAATQAASTSMPRACARPWDAIDEDTEGQRKAQEAIEEQHRQEEKVRLDAAAARRVSSIPGPVGPVRPENKQGDYRKADYVKPDGVYKVFLPPGHVPRRKKSL